MILALLVDGDEGQSPGFDPGMWPGNTADVGSLIPVIDRLQRRFRIAGVCGVADRGVISAETIAELETRRLLYVLAVRELVLDDPVPFVPFTLAKRRNEVDYEAKAVTLAKRRYIVCRNVDEMKKDAAARATIVATLERQLKKGDKSLVGNKGYRRFLANPAGGGFAIDRAKVEEDAKFDGVFALRTNASLSRACSRRADLSQTRRDDPRPRRVQLPRARPEKRSWRIGLPRPTCRRELRGPPSSPISTR